MRNVSTTAARDTVTPTLHKAQETFTDTVLPTVRDAFTTARGKGADFLDSDVALEARRRAIAVAKAAKGDTLVAPKGRRWRFGLGMILAGTGLGFVASWIVRSLSTPVESYTHTMPVPSGTDGGTTTDTTSGITTTSSTSSTSSTTEGIDLRAGSPTNL